MTDTFILKIFRGKPGHQYWEEFELPLVPRMNLISALMEIQKNPVNRKKERVAPVVWEQGCLEEVCGSCSMLVNGRPRQACSAIVAHLFHDEPVIRLAPFTKFPLIRDLCVDRTAMFDNLKKIRGWIEGDGSCIAGFGPKYSQSTQEMMYILSTCMTCGCCSEGCPQVNSHSAFMGPAPISQVRLFNAHPTGKLTEDDRLFPLMEQGGVSDCGNAQNCVRVCPKKIPLTESIAVMGRDVSKRAWKQFFSMPERS